VWLNPFIHWIEAKGIFAPWLFLALFLLASLVMIWRLEALSARGFEGTVLGTLGDAVLLRVWATSFSRSIVGRTAPRRRTDVMVNSLVNNVTNMTLILGTARAHLGHERWCRKAKKPAEGGKKKAKGGVTARMRAEPAIAAD
jgi:cation:H+ antiporter